MLGLRRGRVWSLALVFVGDPDVDQRLPWCLARVQVSLDPLCLERAYVRFDVHDGPATFFLREVGG